MPQRELTGWLPGLLACMGVSVAVFLFALLVARWASARDQQAEAGAIGCSAASAEVAWCACRADEAGCAVP